MKEQMREALERIAKYPMTRSEEMSIETARDIARAALSAVPANHIGDSNEMAQPAFTVGNLVTVNQDDYPALGGLFVQLWDRDDVVARVYGNDHQELNQRIAKMNVSLQAQQPAQEPAPNRNWDEDYKDGENEYECICGICGEHFFGHKRRPVCKICVSNAQNEPNTVEFWRHRALTAESAFEGAMRMLGAENPPTFMGEPVVSKAQEPVKQEPYAYDVPTEDGTELVYAIYFTKYNNPLPEGAIPLYLEAQP